MLLSVQCGNVNRIEMWGIDASTNYLYDVTTGRLIAVSSYVSPGQEPESCAAGQIDSLACDHWVATDLCP